jgi:sugar phosphate isomerase/epimerase
MYNTLIPGAIGIKNLSLQESIELAAAAGYQGVTFDIKEAKALADAHGVDHVKALFADRGIRPAIWSAPVNWQNDDTRDTQLAELPPYTELAAQLGAMGTTTGIMPANNDRPYDEQYAWLQERIRPFAEALKASGIALGIEFISPKTLRDKFTHQFIYDMKGMLAFAKDVGTGNVGVLFDVWHHYCAHGTLEDMDVLEAKDVIFVHTNDAPEGIEIDQQQDLVRKLPMETGVIPAPAMLKKLAEIGFDGPVGAEPFSQRINDLAANDPMAAAKEVCEAQRKLFAAAGLTA